YCAREMVATGGYFDY
nr:immunoglobulin heavy chain junction region [Mus musculus]